MTISTMTPKGRKCHDYTGNLGSAILGSPHNINIKVSCSQLNIVEISLTPTEVQVLREYLNSYCKAHFIN